MAASVTAASQTVFDNTKTIFVEYFRLTTYYTEQYGADVALLMQVGAFFEIYGTKTAAGTITRSRIQDIAALCGGLAIAEKKNMHGADMIVMAGFRDYNLERYVQLLVDANFTVVVYAQREIEMGNGEYTREHAGTFSPGTFVPHDADLSPKMSNNILCVWMNQYVPILRQKSAQTVQGTVNRVHIVVGAAVVNVFTGESCLFEFENGFEMVPSTFDPLEKFVSTHCPSETILITPFTDGKATTDRIIQFAGIQSRVIHTLSNGEGEAVQNATKPRFIRQILSSFFQEDTYDVCEEFQRYTVATQAYTYLLNFVQERNPHLVRKIGIPIFDNKSTTMVLANHTLRQLNIIEDGYVSASASSSPTTQNSLRSVVSFLNKCCSAGGKRRFYNQMVHPSFDVNWLQREYDAIGLLLGNYDMVSAFRKLLNEVVDLEKIARQLISRKLYPDAVHRLHKSIVAIHQIHTCLLEDHDLAAYFVGASSSHTTNPHTVIAQWIQTVSGVVTSHLHIEKCAGIMSTTNFESNIIQPGVCAELDALLQRREENDVLFHEIRECFNHIMATVENKKSGDYVRVHETEKSGSFLQLTKKRAASLQSHFSSLLRRDASSKIVLLHNGNQHITIPVSDVKLSNASTTNDTLEFPLLDRIVRERLSIRDTLNQRISAAYAFFLERLEQEAYAAIESLAEFVARVDVLQSKTFVAKTYRYCRPEFIAAGNTSQLSARGIRHVLIEHLQTNELYVPNDVDLSSSGILLYGTNAVGKTSLIRAVGIAVIMAQTGMYVPCTSFRYVPYRAIYTRILGNDNLFKGLSMFAVEMSELRVILSSADTCSLVLGDELCSGTETESALSIFMAGLMDLHDKQASFLFATHFHEILKFEEMKRLTRVSVKHMAVHYDRETDSLIYDRLLRSGPGNRLYGLEVAKSLHLPDAFIETAYQIRNTYFPEMQGELTAASVSRYNAKKVRGFCEMCNVSLATETHHLLEQRHADKDGFIAGTAVHKNHVANLAALCEACHLKMHHKAEEDGKPTGNVHSATVRKKTTSGKYVLRGTH